MNAFRVRQARRWLWLLVIGHLLLAVAYSLSVPLGEAPDEADHWAYVVYLARERRLPVGPVLTQAKHPPLYHATAAAVAALAVPQVGDLDTRLYLRANPDVTFRVEEAQSGAFGLNSFIHTTYEAWPWRPGPLAFRLARFWTVVLSTWTVLAAYLVLRHAFPEREMVVLAGTAAVAFLPEFAFIGGVVNNDAAAALLATLALAGGLRAGRKRSLRAGWWTPLALGLGVWAKVSTLAVWPAALLAAWMPDGRGPRIGRGALRRGAAVLAFYGGAALLLAAPWFGRNWVLYRDPFGWELARQTVDVRTTPWTWGDTVWLLRGWLVSFWGRFGSAGHIPMAGPVYVLLAGSVALAALGLARGWRRASAGERWGVVVLALAALGVVLAIWRYSLLALGTDQGRLLFPALAAWLGLWAYGLLAWVPQRWHAAAALGLALGMAGLGLYGLVGVIRPAYAPPPPAPRAEWASATLATPVQFGDLTLIAARLDEDPVLYWTVAQPTERDWRVRLRITAVDGTLVWEWKRSPGAGRWSTDHWPPGYVMRDRYRVRWPDWAGPGRYRVEVGVYPFMGDPVVPQSGGKPVASPDHPLFMVGWLRR